MTRRLGWIMAAVAAAAMTAPDTASAQRRRKPKPKPEPAKAAPAEVASPEDDGAKGPVKESGKAGGKQAQLFDFEGLNLDGSTRMPQLLGFVEERNLRGSGMLHVWQKELSVLSGGQPFILVDMQQWAYTDIVNGLQNIPFTENAGQYWGPPADDDAAIQELERLRATGAGSIVFAWHAFWWFDYYPRFYQHLSTKYSRTAAGDHLVAFDLQA